MVNSYLATTSDVNTVYSRLVFSSAGSEVMALWYCREQRRSTLRKILVSYRLFRFRDLKYVGILETTATLVGCAMTCLLASACGGRFKLYRWT